MSITICRDEKEVGRRAAAHAAEMIRTAVHDRGRANVVFSAGIAQFEVIAALVEANNVEWPKVAAFQLNEYLGLPATHPASFRRYLKERLADRVPIGECRYIDGEADAESECRRLSELISAVAVDVVLLGVGANGYFDCNGRPTDFRAERPYVVVELDEACRRLKLGEGWFSALEEVPRRTISMSIGQIMKSRTVICSASDRRRAAALRAAVEGPVTPQLPASALQEHPQAAFYLHE
ncbi:MAG: 6-phosphogluconolactonase [Pirellulales bacterium]|nr:6-phosphogluconolactonase [Pirellulales bacterium]